MHLSSIPLVAILLVLAGPTQAQIYRCGNEYTNKITDAQKGQCKLLEGGNVTVIQGFKAPAAPAAGAPTVKLASAAPPASRVDSAEQKARDSDAKLILEAELKKAEALNAQLLQEYNSGEPEKQGGEARNYQKYLDRVAELKASLARNESDIAGIRRELGRVTAAK
ncbi:MAG: hypothetical protein ABI434_07360 [Burkholderiaceae bacterium]